MWSDFRYVLPRAGLLCLGAAGQLLATTATPTKTETNSVGPAAVTDLLLTEQGANSESLSWTPAVPGAYPIASYSIYRNGTLYATRIKGTTYRDKAATSATTPGLAPQPYIPATVYKYAVSAVDAQGTEGPLQSSCTAWVYHDGIDYWTMSINKYNGGVDFTDTDKTGEPQHGAKNDIAITVTNPANWWQPFSGAPFLTTDPPTWAMELGSFNYMIIDLKPTRPNQTWRLNIVSRVTTGDNYNSAQVTLGAGQFGPVAQAGKWATYKIPFLAPGFADGNSLQMGFGRYVGAISGTTLTVTHLVSGMNVQGSSFLSGDGIIQGSKSGTGTYVSGTQGTSGGPGTYQVMPSQTVASTTITAQRTNMYKFGLMDGSGGPAGNNVGAVGNVYYVDNIGFTTD